MLVSEDTEIQIDKQYSPLQFSSDFGEAQDSQLNRYVSQIGNKMAAASHRPQMPYSFRVVNATYVNAYAFPGGSIAATRGIMLELDNEAELASLLGHELGHVNARHAAEQMSKGQLTQAVVGGVSVLVGTQSAALGDLAGQLGQISAGAKSTSFSTCCGCRQANMAAINPPRLEPISVTGPGGAASTSCAVRATMFVTVMRSKSGVFKSGRRKLPPCSASRSLKKSAFVPYGPETNPCR